MWWTPDHAGAAIKNDGEKTNDGTGYDVLTVTPKAGKPFEAWFDAKTHLLVPRDRKTGRAADHHHDDRLSQL